MNNNFNKASSKTKRILILLAILSVSFLIFIFFNNNESYNQLEFNNLLLVIIGASATILAIVFALSQFILQNVSKKYSPKILDEYENNLEAHRLFFLYLVIISIILVFVVSGKTILVRSGLLHVLIFSGIIYMFIIALIFLIDYIKLMFTYTNPFKYSNLKKSQTIIAFNTKNKDKLNEGFIILGDLSIKSLIENEESVTKHTIQNLYTIFSENIGVENDE
ncbi:hypothetical protein KTG15_02690 [Methanobacterium sp. YSL]|nr:hypothetical protein [Methanobacterium sp. YSL]